MTTGAGYDTLRRAIDDPTVRGTVPAVELAAALLERIAQCDPALNAFITVTPDLALADAARADAARAAGAPLPLDGMPIAVKDLIDVAGVRCTAASRLFADRIPTEDAVIVARLRAAGGVVLGKTNMDEIAFGATTTNPPPFGTCRNPWNTTRVAGGSSGGSGAAVAADLCVAALGSDTGGSIRIPSSLCGTSGLRPTFGTVSNRGSFHLCPSFDTLGPLARSVADLERLHAVIVGVDPEDPWAVVHPPAREVSDVRGLRIGVPRALFFDNLGAGVEAAVRAAADTLAGLGAAVEDIDLSADEALSRATAAVLRAEALATYRELYDRSPELIGPEVLRRFRIGEQLSGEEVAAAHVRIREWQWEVRRAFGEVDVILTPTTGITAPPIDNPDPIETTWALTHLTYPWNAAQTPALSVPCGIAPDGLPVGVQLVAAPLGEATLFRLGSAYQQVTDWHRRRPAAV